MKCNEIMTKDPTCCLPTDTVDKAAQLMKTENVGPIPVVEKQDTGKLVGIVTDRDLALKVVAEGRDPKSTTVKEVMTTGVKTCRADDEIQKTLDAMEKQQLRRIPVVDENDKIIGIIAQADIATRLGKAQQTAEVVEEISKARAVGHNS